MQSSSQENGPARFGVETAATAGPSGGPGPVRALIQWLGGTRLGLVAMALVVGVGAGLGAVAFRELIFAFTWLFTGHQSFGQQGRVGSLHFPGLGILFVLFVPVIGGLLYGPMIQRFAREARGHGVPEVMLAVAENGGRIRPPVTIVKALASALCIGTGGSVGREGPIVQVGSALASTMGQLVRMSETHLRIIVACGAAGGISATFNAPITGLFFGFEIVLREFSLDALFATALSAVTADVISRAFFGSAPFLTGAPHGLSAHNDLDFLLFAVLALIAGLIGWGFKTVLYRTEDVVDELWRGRPEWARPAVGGIALGLILLALPQMYGVGYPVMDQVLANHKALWFMVVLILGKILAVSTTLAIGGSGGVFAPSLFTGAAAGMAFGVIVHHLFGAITGPPAIYGVLAMGGVFSAAAHAPLTSIASIAEMTGNFTLTLPIMLVTGIAAALSKRLSYGSIYTTKLLRRGIDIERPNPGAALRAISVRDVMQPIPASDGPVRLRAARRRNGESVPRPDEVLQRLVGPMTDNRVPQALFPEENLEQALRQLILYGRDGLPVVSHTGEELLGWVTRRNVLQRLGSEVGITARDVTRGAIASEFNVEDPESQVHKATTPLSGHRLIELRITPDSPALGRRIDEIDWPDGVRVVAVTEGREVVVPRSGKRLEPGDRAIVLTPTESHLPASAVR